MVVEGMALHVVVGVDVVVSFTLGNCHLSVREGGGVAAPAAQITYTDS